MGNGWVAASSWQHICSFILSRAEFLVKHQITQVTQPPYSPDLASCNFWLFLKLKPPLKGKRFQTVNKFQENKTGQLMTIRRTVWGPKGPTLKGTEVSLSYVQCFLYLVTSSINISIFHITWLVFFSPASEDRELRSRGEKRDYTHVLMNIWMPGNMACLWNSSLVPSPPAIQNQTRSRETHATSWPIWISWLRLS